MRQMAVTEHARMLKDINTISFTLVELTLYLDTHPHDKQAMEYFNHYARIEKQMKQEFSSKYYPLNASLSTDQKEWTWATAPMPWEGGC
ncbi:MAG: spore coat protein CotJB [Lachnospiraceae bacterium]|nr:spore coat protein CotJB [Lachnospiraceae bacterium]